MTTWSFRTATAVRSPMLLLFRQDLGAHQKEGLSQARWYIGSVLRGRWGCHTTGQLNKTQASVMHGNPATLKQVPQESAEPLRDLARAQVASIFEQGAGLMNLIGAHKVLQTMQSEGEEESS